MSVRRLFVTLVSWMIATLAVADSGWTDYGRVEELMPTSKHYFEVRLSSPGNPSGCNTSEWYYQNYVSRGAREMFTVLLEALKEELEVRVYVTGVCNINGYSEISAVGLAR